MWNVRAFECRRVGGGKGWRDKGEVREDEALECTGRGVEVREIEGVVVVEVREDEALEHGGRRGEGVEVGGMREWWER